MGWCAEVDGLIRFGGGGVYSPTELYRHVQHQSGVVFESFEIGINFNHFGVRI